VKLTNVEFLIDGNGHVMLGRIGPVHCAAVASDGARSLAMLVKDADESLDELLVRLDAAIEDALERDIFVDEING
jgi:hypothetical protein